MVGTDGGLTAVRTDVAHPARVYDWWLGGKDNYEADREFGRKVLETSPFVVGSVRANRAFLKRTVRFLAEAAGITQFLDIGSGFPTQENVHEVAQYWAPRSRVVYVDNDPVVLVHGRALLRGSRVGGTRVVHGDLRDAGRIVNDPQVRDVLDFDRPVAVLMTAVLHYVTDADRPRDAVARLRDALAPGSHVVVSQSSWELVPSDCCAAARRTFEEDAPYTFVGRSHSQILSFFDGFELLEPGLVRICDWRPDGAVPPASRAATLYGGVGRKA